MAAGMIRCPQSGGVTPSRAGAASLAILVQLLILVPFLQNYGWNWKMGHPHETLVYLDRASDPIRDVMPSAPNLIHPSNTGYVTPPDIDELRRSVESLPPRPDPAHPNEPAPSSRFGSGVYHGTLIVLIHALVKENGAIGDAEIAGSCGIESLDAEALVFVKENWRFLPAIENGEPVARWTTVEVPFAR